MQNYSGCNSVWLEDHLTTKVDAGPSDTRLRAWQIVKTPVLGNGNEVILIWRMKCSYIIKPQPMLSRKCRHLFDSPLAPFYLGPHLFSAAIGPFLAGRQSLRSNASHPAPCTLECPDCKETPLLSICTR